MNDKAYLQELEAKHATETNSVKRHRIQRAIYYTSKRLLERAAAR